jgi:dipeptidyl aminopeptidase/acylaminoacyl peptidase
MTKPQLFLAAAAAALAASPAVARPMTAVDLQSMHRLGSPTVSPDGHWAVFTVSSTDWAKNKRVNTLNLLDLTKPGAQPQPVAGAEKGHDAVIGRAATGEAASAAAAAARRSEHLVIKRR